MPDYVITVYLKFGRPKQGIRYHASYDTDHVKAIAETKAVAIYGRVNVDRVTVVFTPRNVGTRIDTKPL